MVKKVLFGIVALLLALLAAVTAMNWLAPLTTANLLRDLSRAMAGLESKSVVAQGQTFPYLTGGSGEALVLVHGFTANKDVWDAVARYLTTRYTVYAPDLPGFGDAARQFLQLVIKHGDRRCRLVQPGVWVAKNIQDSHVNYLRIE